MDKEVVAVGDQVKVSTLELLVSKTTVMNGTLNVSYTLN